MSVTLEKVSERITKSNDRTDRYLAFRLAGQLYGIRARQVQGLRAWSGMAAVPGMPRFVLGVLRDGGAQMPVIDLRHLFKIPPVPFGPSTVVALVRTASDTGQTHVIGLMFDAMAGRAEFGSDAVAQPRDLAEIARTRAASGIATLDGERVVLLDTDRLMSGGVLQTVESL